MLVPPNKKRTNSSGQSQRAQRNGEQTGFFNAQGQGAFFRPANHAPFIQRQPHAANNQRNPITECMATDELLPGGVGLLTHIMRESELTNTLGSERPLLERQIRANPEARRFVCEAGVPAIVALYDTRRAGIQLEVGLARQALAHHPTHYGHGALGQRRHLLLQPAFTSFRSQTPIFVQANDRTPFARLELGRRIHFLTHTVVNGRRKVRVISGPYHGIEGYIPVAQLTTPTATSISTRRKIRLVFMENPERIGTTMMAVRVGLTSQRTRLRVPQEDGGDRFYTIPGRRKFAIETSGHTATELRVRMRVPGQHGRIEGFLQRDHTQNDFEFRRLERRYFVQVGRRIARDRRAVFVDPASQTCINEPLPIEFFNGQDIARGIVAAANCADALVEEVHIVGHGGSHGMPGTGDLADYTGLYVRGLQGAIQQQGRTGAMTVEDFVSATDQAMSNGIKFWLHACGTAENRFDGVPDTEETIGLPRIPGFAEQLARELRGAGHDEASVGGLRGIGPADSGYVRRKSFVIYPTGNRGYIAPLRRGE